MRSLYSNSRNQKQTSKQTTKKVISDNNTVKEIKKGNGSLKDQQTFSIKGQIVNILGFVGQTISVATTQVSGCNTNM